MCIITHNNIWSVKYKDVRVKSIKSPILTPPPSSRKSSFSLKTSNKDDNSKKISQKEGEQILLLPSGQPFPVLPFKINAGRVFLTEGQVAANRVKDFRPEGRICGEEKSSAFSTSSKVHRVTGNFLTVRLCCRQVIAQVASHFAHSAFIWASDYF